MKIIHICRFYFSQKPWGEAYPWKGIPEEIIREEYGGEIPFELIDPDNIETFSVPVNN